MGGCCSALCAGSDSVAAGGGQAPFVPPQGSVPRRGAAPPPPSQGSEKGAPSPLAFSSASSSVLGMSSFWRVGDQEWPPSRVRDALVVGLSGVQSCCEATAMLAPWSHWLLACFLGVETAEKGLKFGDGGQSADLKEVWVWRKADDPWTRFLAQPMRARMAFSDLFLLGAHCRQDRGEGSKGGTSG